MTDIANLVEFIFDLLAYTIFRLKITFISSILSQLLLTSQQTTESALHLFFQVETGCLRSQEGTFPLWDAFY